MVIEYPPGANRDRHCERTLRPVETDTVRLYDLVVVEKGPDGSCAEIDLSDSFTRAAP